MATPLEPLDPLLFALPGGHVERRLAALREIMERYISPILVAGVFETALDEERKFGRIRDDAVVERCMIGLRLFVSSQELPSLMLELAEELESPRFD